MPERVSPDRAALSTPSQLHRTNPMLNLYGVVERRLPVLRQIVYQSRVDPAAPPADLAQILRTAQQLNALDGITGLLYADGARFLQVIEGPEESIALTYARIVADDRHGHILKLVDRAIEAREFGDWTMADRSDRRERDLFDIRMKGALAEASPETRRWFDEMVEPA